jgi:hypothetical protein
MWNRIKRHYAMLLRRARLMATSHPLLRRLGRWTRHSLHDLCVLLALLVATRLACEAAWWLVFASRRVPPGGAGTLATLAVWGRGHAGGGEGARWEKRVLTTTMIGEGGEEVGVLSNVRNHTTAYLGRVVPAAVEGWVEYTQGYGYWPCRRRYRVTPGLELVPGGEEAVRVVIYDQGIGAWRHEYGRKGKRCARAQGQAAVELDQQWWSWEEIENIEDGEMAEQAEATEEIDESLETRETREARERRDRQWWKKWDIERKRTQEEQYRARREREEMEVTMRWGKRDLELDNEMLKNRQETDEELELFLEKWGDSRRSSNTAQTE